jgi:hypothetical protein
MDVTNEAILKLNVGGTYFSTYRSTLCKYEGKFADRSTQRIQNRILRPSDKLALIFI